MKNESENIVAKPMDTPEAQVLWGILIAYGYLGEDLKPVDLDDKKATLLADSIATLLKISPRWEPFELMWGMTDMAATFSSISETDSCREWIKEVNAVMPSPDILKMYGSM